MIIDMSLDNTKNTISDVSVVTQKIKLVLLTIKGEVLYDPDYGCDIHQFIFEPQSKQNSDKMISAALKSLDDYVPEFYVEKINIERDVEDGILRLRIQGTAVGIGDPVDTVVVI